MHWTNDASSTLPAYRPDALAPLLCGEFVGTSGWMWLGFLGLVMVGGEARGC